VEIGVSIHSDERLRGGYAHSSWIGAELPVQQAANKAEQHPINSGETAGETPPNDNGGVEDDDEQRPMWAKPDAQQKVKACALIDQRANAGRFGRAGHDGECIAPLARLYI